MERIGREEICKFLPCLFTTTHMLFCFVQQEGNLLESVTMS